MVRLRLEVTHDGGILAVLLVGDGRFESIHPNERADVAASRSDGEQ
jgi:hypothetical protein